MIQLNANRGIAQSGLFAGGSFQSREFMPGAYGFRRQITPVVGIDCGLERNAGGDFDAGFCETVELGWVVGKQHDPRAIQGSQHHRRNSIVALIILEAQRRVGVARIETAVLQSISSHLVRKADAAAFLGKVQNDATADAFQARERDPKLIATVASPRAKYVAGQACRMKPNRNGFSEIGLADDDGHLIDAESVPKHDKARHSTRRQRNWARR